MDRDQQETIQADFDCMVCLETLYQPVKCHACGKMLCHRHLLSMKNRCPHCRTEPFKVELQFQLNDKLKEVRMAKFKENTKGKKLYCQIKGCHFIGYFPYLIHHHRFRHSQLDIEQVVFGQREKEAEVPMYPSNIQILHAIWVSTRPKKASPGERVKIPSFNLALKMSRHYKQCMDPGCQKVWTGKWGTYIGTNTGVDNFNLTVCPIGKKLNEEAGWIYGQWKK